MASMPIQSFSASLIIREMQIKGTLKYYSRPLEHILSKRTKQKIARVAEYGKVITLVRCGWMGNDSAAPKNVKIE
jgi:hypothetical protein